MISSLGDQDSDSYHRAVEAKTLAFDQVNSTLWVSTYTSMKLGIGLMLLFPIFR